MSCVNLNIVVQALSRIELTGRYRVHDNNVVETTVVQSLDYMLAILLFNERFHTYRARVACLLWVILCRSPS